MRIAFITVGDTGRKTGGYMYNGRVIFGLRKRGFEIEEVVAGGASPDEQRKAAPRFGTTFDPSGYDAIVVDALARIAVAPHLDLWLSRRPVVALVHELPSLAGGGSGPETIACERDYEEPLLRAHRLVAVSNNGRNVLLGRGVSSGRIRVVPPGFDGIPEGVGPHVQGSGPVRALCVAQWIERKGILTLVEAWALGERKGAVLELIGETDADPDYAVLVGDAIEAAPRGSIIVSGCVDDAALGASYAGADFFILPSRYEGYGIVYAEALARGLPIIACDIGPVPDLVGREAAVLIRPDLKEELSAALDLLIGDPALRASMSAAASRRATRLPRWEDTVSGFEQVLRTAAETGKQGPM
ncbi:MAG: glycosyltransferase family 4 protein [Actinomycetota bacterium]|nr:glycosyltransferase family 4 protein [Actinomycetota bacterium]